MEPDSATAQPTQPVDPTTDFKSPNDLDFEMSPEDEKAYVDSILGDTLGTVLPEPAQPVDPVKPEEKPVTQPEPVTPVAPAVPEPVVTPAVEALSEPIKTDDLWIEVDKVTEDDLGEKKTEKIKLIFDPSDPASFIPEDFSPKSTKQLADILEAKSEMARLYDERKGEFDTIENKKLETENSAKVQKEILDSWDNEIADLIEIGSIPTPKVNQGEAGYDDDPSVKMTDAVFQFMTKTNAERATAGQSPIRSFGTAFAMYQKDAEVIAVKEAKEKEIKDTKQKGGMIGGGSAASTGGAKPLYKSGSANNIWQVPVE